MIDYKTVSLANQVHQRIESDILNGVYSPGEIISETKLSEELGVSRTPIREALAKLTNEKLICDSPMGTKVLGITKKDVEDMFEVKRRIEVVATGWAAKNMGEKGLGDLKDILEQQEFYAAKGNAEKVRNLDTEFHNVIYRESGSPVFEAILHPMHHKLLKYRKASLEQENRILNSVNEHKAIYEAILEGDAEKVENLMLIHIQRAFDSIMKGNIE